MYTHFRTAQAQLLLDITSWSQLFPLVPCCTLILTASSKHHGKAVVHYFTSCGMYVAYLVENFIFRLHV